MKEAIALFNGEIILADKTESHQDYFAKGFICPLCKNNLFWVQKYTRKGKKVSASFRHHKGMGMDCEARATTLAYRKFLAQCTPEAKEQRLIVFNNQFWKIFKIDKDIPQGFAKITFPQLEEVAKHCHKLWHPEQVIIAANKFLDEREAPLRNAFSSFFEENEETVNELVKTFDGAASPLSSKIREEVIYWLKTPSAFPAFKKIIKLAIFDVAEQSDKLPLHTNAIATSAMYSLALTDWAKSIETFKAQSSQAKGFAR